MKKFRLFRGVLLADVLHAYREMCGSVGMGRFY